MVNASCCPNSYNHKPNAGYYKISSGLKASLCVKERLDLNIICGEHFSDTDISPSGRLKPGTNPVFFPRQCTTFQDHSYFYKILEQPEDEGMYFSFQPLGWARS